MQMDLIVSLVVSNGNKSNMLNSHIRLRPVAPLTNMVKLQLWDEITYPFPNFNGATIEV